MDFSRFKVLVKLNSLYKKYVTLRKFSTVLSFPPQYNFKVLGIETSCDDTGCAVVDSTSKLLGDSLHSQNVIHLRFGGINPLVAHELHRNNIECAVNEALDRAKMKLSDVDAIGVTVKPGLLISLDVGFKYAKYLARKFCKPLVPIHHMEAHALIARMYYTIPFPFITLLISGGHCLLAIVNSIEDFILLGECLDNAPGEIMDKAARRMKLRNIPLYSNVAGGKAIELAAKSAKNPLLFEFPIPLLKNRDCNFSFSGLRNALERHLIEKELEHGIKGDGIIPEINDLCAAFQLAIAEHIVQRTERAILFCENKSLIPHCSRNIVISGGVACNNFIYKAIEAKGKILGYKTYRPPSKLCTDNGVMIAWNTIEKLKKPFLVPDLQSINIMPKAPMGKNIINQVVAANLPVKITRLKEMY